MTKTFDIPVILDDSDFFNTTLLDPPSFDENIESLTLEDVDRAIFDFIDKKLNIQTNADNILKKVPVIFAAGERWALVRQRKALRDENGTIILPLISVRRTEIDTSYEQSLPAGNAAIKSVVFKVKRSPKNSNYQNLKNTLGLRFQDNAAKNYGTSRNTSTSTPPALKTSRRSDAQAFKGTVFRGKQMVRTDKPEIVDLFSIPYPDFVKVTYEIAFWAQYQEEMNQIFHRYRDNFAKFSVDQFKIDTPSGYHFMAFGQPNINNESNIEEFTDTERIIRQVAFLDVPAYFIQTQVGEDHLIHKFTSSPEISFESYAIDDVIEKELKSLGKKNPLEERQGKLGALEDPSSQVSSRPREKRNEYRTLTKSLKKKQVGETVTTFRNIEELDRFFR